MLPVHSKKACKSGRLACVSVTTLLLHFNSDAMCLLFLVSAYLAFMLELHCFEQLPPWLVQGWREDIKPHSLARDSKQRLGERGLSTRKKADKSR